MFGVSSFLAIRTLQKLVDDESHVFLKAAEVIKKHFYEDDLTCGADSIDEARVIRDRVASPR